MSATAPLRGTQAPVDHDGGPSTDFLAHVRPSARQLRWQQLELYGFVHFGMNTMTDREWGDGSEDPAWFDPADVDTDQWAREAVAAGMRGLILTCKHHDGFSLWPTRHSRHSVASSPWRGGEGDLVAEVARSCAEHGLRFGVYLSPWDRAEASYGSGVGYDDFFVAQLTELLTGYGELFCVWFDGANGEGPNGRRQHYDWERYHRVVRALQPEAVISVCGPDVRWCGNEAGHTRAEEWSVVPHQLRDAELVAEKSQQADDGSFSRLVRSDDADLGSRAALAAYGGEPVWYPAEVNTSTRPGWFHHDTEDDQVRSAEELFEIYRGSVGGNATFLLNVPPRRDGRIAEPDVESLRGLGRLVREWYDADVRPGATLSESSRADGAVAVPRLADASPGTSWRPAADDEQPWVRLTWPEPVRVRAVVLREDLAVGQRIERVQVRSGGTVLAETTSVGYQRFVALPDLAVDELTVAVVGSRGVPTLAALGVVAVPADGSSS